VEAETIANSFKAMIEPWCSRIELAGSIRRRKAEVGDVEIVAQPWSSASREQLHGNLAQLENNGLIKLDRKSSDGKKAPFGPRYYRLSLAKFPLDLFMVLPPADWGVIFTLRTGSKSFSHFMATRALQLGMRIREGQLFRVTRHLDPVIHDSYEKIPCNEEKDLFEALGVKWAEPQDREAGLPQYTRTPKLVPQGVAQL
jgi:DNA polymerase/3'-5' exonuclease PolX